MDVREEGTSKQEEIHNDANNSQRFLNQPNGPVDQVFGDKVAGDKIAGDKIAGDKILGDKILIEAAMAYDVRGLPNPYLGLRAFTYADQEAYAGREALVAEALTRLTDPSNPQSLLFITGDSGSGKSSFAQAGLLPALEAHYQKRHKTVRLAVFRPGSNPLATLADALSQLGLPCDYQSLNGSVPETFGLSMVECTPAEQVNLLVIDQFEELFTQSSPEARGWMFAFMGSLPPFASLKTHLIATLRSDYLKELFQSEALWQVAKGGVELRGMSPESLQAAILGPLEARGRGNERYRHKQFQPELLARLVQDAGQDATYLPLLQVTLEDLWQRGALTLGAYAGLGEAIRRRAEAVYAFRDFERAQPAEPRPPEERAALLDLLLDQVEVSPDDDPRRDVRRRREKEDLVGDSILRRGLVEDLTRARLLAISREPRGEASVETVDIIHESLIANWGRLQEAVAGRREQLKHRARFEAALDEWQDKEKSADYLLSGVRLAEGRILRQGKDIALRSEAALEFLAASEAQAGAAHRRELEKERRRARTARIFTAAIGVLLLLAILAAGWASRQTSLLSQEKSTSEARRAAAEQAQATAEAEKRVSRSRELAALAQLEINNRRPEVAVQLALYALENLPYTLQAEQALAQAVQDSRLIKRLPEVQSARWSPEGDVWAVVSQDNAIAVFDVNTNQERWRLPFDSQVLVLRWSPTGDRLLVQEVDGDDTILFAEDGGVLFTHDGPPLAEFAGITSEWAPDGMSIATALQSQTLGTGGTFQIWDAKGGNPLHELRVNPQAIPQELLTFEIDTIGDLAWSPDGSQIVVVHPLAGCCGLISVWDARQGTMQQVLEAAPYHSVAWSPDGRWVAASGAFHGGSPTVWDTQTWTGSLVSLGQSVNAGDVAWSPEGNYLAVVSQGNDSLWVWDADRQALVLQVNGDFDQVDWAPQGDRLLAHEWGSGSASLISLYPANYRFELDGGQIGVWSPDGSQVLNASPTRAHLIADALANPAIQPGAIDLPFLDDTLFFGELAHPVWLADGRLAVTDGYSSELWDLNLGVRLPLDESLANSEVHWSPSGNQYAIARQEDYQVYDSQGDLLFTLPRTTQEDEFSLLHIAWNPSETKLATSDGNLVRFWDAKDGKSLGVLEGGQFPVSSISWSPDGSRLATTTGSVLIGATGYSASGENLVRVWDVTSRREVYRLESAQDDVINLVAWSPDGHYLLTGNPIPGQDNLRLWQAWASLEDLLDFARACCSAYPLSDEQREQFEIPSP